MIRERPWIKLRSSYAENTILHDCQETNTWKAEVTLQILQRIQVYLVIFHEYTELVKVAILPVKGMQYVGSEKFQRLSSQNTHIYVLYCYGAKIFMLICKHIL